VLLGSLVWIVVISVLALAISALVRWRPLAGFFLLAIYFAGEFFAFIVRQLFDTDAGQLVNIRRLIRIVWAGLLGTEVPEGPPGWLAWAGLAAIVAVSMLLLRKQIRAYEVVR
jgi:hypothetical protein